MDTQALKRNLLDALERECQPILEQTCLDCDAEMAPTSTGRCADCERKRDENGPDDDPDAWSGGFADNH